MKKDNSIYLYYFILLLILIFGPNIGSAPNTLLRIGYVTALLLPFFVKHIALLPMVLISFYSISSYGFSYSYLPSKLYIYLLLIIGVIAFNKINIKTNSLTHAKFYMIILLYIVVVDLFTSIKIENIAYSITIITFLSLCINMRDKKNIQYFTIAFLIISLTLSSAYVFYGKNFVIYNQQSGFERMGWTDANYLGCVIGMGTIIAIMELLKKNRSIVYILFLLVTTILSLITLVINASRGAILAITVSTLILLLISKIKWSYKFSIIILLFSIAALLYYNQYFNLLIYRFEIDDGTGAGRTMIWLTKLKAFYIEKNPLQWLFGLGYNGGFKLGFSYATGFHNDFIAFLIDYGILGLSLFVWALIIPTKEAKREMKPTIMALTLYLTLCCMTLEPITAGRLTYFGFYFYIILLAKTSQSKVTFLDNSLNSRFQIGNSTKLL